MKMTRDECESRIAELVEEIKELHKEYNPNADYLAIVIFDGSYWFNNEHWEEDDDTHNGRGRDADYPIDFFKNTEEAE